MNQTLILIAVLLVITLGSWFLLGPKPPEKGLPHYNLHVIDILETGPDEVVSIANQGEEPIDLSGWTIYAHVPKERPGTVAMVYHFPDGCMLNGLHMVRVHSGPEALDHSRSKCEGKTPDLFWTISYVWCDQNGDTAYIYDAKGNLVNRFDYGAGWHLDVDISCAASGK